MSDDWQWKEPETTASAHTEGEASLSLSSWAAMDPKQIGLSLESSSSRYDISKDGFTSNERLLSNLGLDGVPSATGQAGGIKGKVGAAEASTGEGQQLNTPQDGTQLCAIVLPRKKGVGDDSTAKGPGKVGDEAPGRNKDTDGDPGKPGSVKDASPAARPGTRKRGLPPLPEFPRFPSEDPFADATSRGAEAPPRGFNPHMLGD